MKFYEVVLCPAVNSVPAVDTHLYFCVLDYRAGPDDHDLPVRIFMLVPLPPRTLFFFYLFTTLLRFFFILLLFTDSYVLCGKDFFFYLTGCLYYVWLEFFCYAYLRLSRVSYPSS